MVIDWIFENCYKQRNRVLTFAISIHAPRTGSDGSHRRAKFTAAISIHAPRTGSDSQAGDGARLLRRISIHAPRTGSDTPSAAGSSGLEYFNPRSPHGERPGPHSTNKNAISFQSTLPARGATVVVKVPICRAAISIHAPRTGSDEHDLSVPCLRRQFQSTLPARGATHEMRHTYISIIFQSTLPARGATRLTRAGSGTGRFQSTLPARGATVHAVLLVALVPISIHAPRTGSDAERWPLLSGLQYFNPRSPHGERRDGTLLLFAAQ